ncbi:MAG: signal peptide peptidase SppA [Patescibacteria group bacterium]
MIKMKLPRSRIITFNPNKRGKAPFSWWRVFVVLGLFLMVACTTAVVVGVLYIYNYDSVFSDGEEELTAIEESSDQEDCNVYAEKLHGMLDTYVPPEGSENAGDIVGSEDIVFNIESAAADSEIKAVLIDIDSSGGYAVAADEIAKALKALDKPSVAVIRGYGDSAAYWAATGADIIFASPLSDVGSIGITSSYLENSKYNNTEGYTYQQLSLGKYKDMGDPDKPLTAEEKEIIMNQLEQAYNYFIQVVATNRNIPIEEVKKLATGTSFTGTEALELKLIDALGGIPEATAWLEKQINAKPELCW